MTIRSKAESGFTYLGLLFFVAAMGAALAASGMLWATSGKRVKERELLFIGDQFRMAIASYYERTPGTVKRFPASLEDLLKDNRQAGTVRHLRRIYVDPFSLAKEWGLVKATDGGIQGVYSLSADVPLKTGGFEGRNSMFEDAKDYAGWRFIYVPAEQSKPSPAIK